ncbi:aspartyl-phosphate phosphatase Spo0E family protein [Paenibacillus sp. NEAU-GSW1]|uniref:aspartyl-phosphate phosphatase Spo0E family protein n=1 Tax=Paenibacillus sp. NEAU-GSW1 TaxID=2682486 RepID=UPI0012E30221|nr:aspartyl-phosphate phosphatase Spo0E family protein [Paenibacillus sp. NEAU-GSW1]MUT67924.1 Spo0E family sporulation regulatory protein-aspartic acid phosphatase [Paenibacillus sp. NEAU-GSW1]
MDKTILLNQLQSLRLKLHEIAEARGSLTDPDVIAISEEADELIVALQQLQRARLIEPPLRTYPDNFQSK